MNDSGDALSPPLRMSRDRWDDGGRPFSSPFRLLQPFSDIPVDVLESRLEVRKS